MLASKNKLDKKAAGNNSKQKIFEMTEESSAKKYNVQKQSDDTYLSNGCIIKKNGYFHDIYNNDVLIASACHLDVANALAYTYTSNRNKFNMIVSIEKKLFRYFNENCYLEDVLKRASNVEKKDALRVKIYQNRCHINTYHRDIIALFSFA